MQTTKKSSHLAGSLAVRLPARVAGSVFEKTVAAQLLDHNIHSIDALHSISLDLSSTNFIDPYSLQVIVAYIASFDRHGIDCNLRLPRRKAVRDFIRAWGYDYALITALNRSLFSLVDRDDRVRFFRDREQQTTFDLRDFPKGMPGFGRSSSAHTERLTNRNIESAPRSDNFFGFNSFDVSSLPNKIRTAHEEKEDWKSNNIRSFCAAKMGINAEYLASRVVFEALFNALRHPDATVVQTATLPLPPSKAAIAKNAPQSDEFCLTLAAPNLVSGRSVAIHYWDDGGSMLDVLKSRLRENGKDIRTGTDKEFFTRYRVHLRDKDTGVDHDYLHIDSDMELNSDTPDHLKLVALAFPHLSSAPNLPGHAVAEETKNDDQRLAARGMGLYLLIHAATQIMNGTVAIRTGHHQIEFTRNGYRGIRKDPQWNHDINVVVRRLPSVLPSLTGNLIAIRLRAQ